MHWWLPNDEGYSPIIRSIRKFVEERTSPATDLPKEDLRDMKQIFSSLRLDDGPSNLAPNEGNPQDVSQINSGQNPSPAFDSSQNLWYKPQR
jgi:hypothetical protein